MTQSDRADHNLNAVPNFWQPLGAIGPFVEDKESKEPRSLRRSFDQCCSSLKAQALPIKVRGCAFSC